MNKRTLSLIWLVLTVAPVIFVVTLFLLFGIEKNHTAGYEGALLISEIILVLILSISGVYFLKTDFYKDKISPKISHAINGKTLIFLSVLIFTQILALIFLGAADGDASRSFLFQDSIDSFMDFFNSMYTKEAGEGYEGGSIYPPICYVIYGIFTSIIPDAMFDNPSPRDAAFAIRASQAGIVALTVFLLTALIAFLYAVIFSRKKSSTGVSLLFALALLLSAPSVFAIERGNIILYSLPALIFFVFGYKSENKIVREISLVALAFSTTLKITPAVFYLLLLSEKRYKEFFRAVIYAAVLFFLPFLYFGGLGQVFVLIKNVFSFSGAPGSAPQIHPSIPHVNTVSFSGALNFISAIFTGSFETLGFHSKGGIILSILLLALSFLTHGWKRVMCLSLVLCGLFRSNTPYVLIYIFVPLIMFLSEDFSKRRWLDGVYTFLFLMMCVTFPSAYIFRIGKMPTFTAAQSTSPLVSVIIENFALLVVSVILISDIIAEFIKTLRLKSKEAV